MSRIISVVNKTLVLNLEQVSDAFLTVNSVSEYVEFCRSLCIRSVQSRVAKKIITMLRSFDNAFQLHLKSVKCLKWFVILYDQQLELQVYSTYDVE